MKRFYVEFRTAKFERERSEADMEDTTADDKELTDGAGDSLIPVPSEDQRPSAKAERSQDHAKRSDDQLFPKDADTLAKKAISVLRPGQAIKSLLKGGEPAKGAILEIHRRNHHRRADARVVVDVLATQK